MFLTTVYLHTNKRVSSTSQISMDTLNAANPDITVYVYEYIYIYIYDILTSIFLTTSQISMDTLNAANPDITVNTSKVSAGARVCVLADICTREKTN